MTLPRQIIREQFWLITRRCTQRQFLLRPDEATNNAFIYCLAVAAERYQIDVLMSQTESNHHHTVIFDRYGRVSEFVECFHKLVARSQNALRGRRENFWAAVDPCITRLLDRKTVIDKLVYTASNPVKDRLVERLHHWPGASTYASFLNGRPMNATRPRHFFRHRGRMPKTATLNVTIPPELGSSADVIKEVRAGVEAVEKAVYAERRPTGARVVGRRSILAQSWKSSPDTEEPRCVLRPRFAGSTEARRLAIAEYWGFLAAYRRARALWLAGLEAVFPEGTYWLSRFAKIPKVAASR